MALPPSAPSAPPTCFLLLGIAAECAERATDGAADIAAPAAAEDRTADLSTGLTAAARGLIAVLRAARGRRARGTGLGLDLDL
ncbi:MAG: hypothetical protein MUC68_18775 [Burkholderiaceae bacterium]|nr:hypothetical protein [Burkholderiaceae bacterium]